MYPNPSQFYERLTGHHRQDLKAHLSQERDAVRHVTLQKDIDLKNLQARLDKTVCISFLADI